jgi:hypothetical protein
MCYAYYYPAMNVDNYRPFYYHTKNAAFVFEGDSYEIAQPRISTITTALVNKVILVLSRAPGISILFQLGTYAWILIAMAFVCLRARARVGLLLIPFFALLSGVGFTAVNGAVRYALGLIYASPFIVALCVAGVRSKSHAGRIA